MARQRPPRHTRPTPAPVVATTQPRATPAAPAPHVRQLTLGAMVVAATTLSVYATTLNPTVSHGDSGEMIVVAHTFGVAHPPGFPLYALLAGLFAHLPVATVAVRLNLFSALCSAVAAALVFRAATRLSASLPAGLLAAALFAFSPIVWPYAVTAEVFALNNLCAALLLELTSRLGPSDDATRTRHWLVVTAFAFGLGLSNHHILVLLAGPALLLLLLASRRVFVARRQWLLLGLAFGLGLLPYLYLLVAPRFGSEIVWGDTTTPSGLLQHVLRREYGTLRLASGAPTEASATFERLGAFVSRFATTTFGLGPLLVLAALPGILRASAQRLVLSVWAVGLLAHLTVFSFLSNLGMADALHATVQERFWQQALLVAATLAAVGLVTLTRPLGRFAPRAQWGVALVGSLLALGLAFPRMDQRGHVFFRSYGLAILDSLPQGATLVITSDEAIGSVRYLQQVEGHRRDVRVLPAGQIVSPWFRSVAAAHFPELRFPPVTPDGTFTFRAFLDLNLPQGRVFLLNKVPWEQTLEEAYRPLPVGLADEVLPHDLTPPLEPWIGEALASFARFDPGQRGRHSGAWETYVEAGYYRQLERFAAAVGRVAAGHGADPAAARQVLRALEFVAARHPRPPADVLKNAGVACQYLASEDPTTRARMIRYWRAYLAVAPPSDPDRALIERAVLSAGPH